MYHESIEMFRTTGVVNLMTVNNLFVFFSMYQFRKEAKDIASANNFGLEYQDLLLKYFCEEVEFTAEYKEAKDN